MTKLTRTHLTAVWWKSPRTATRRAKVPGAATRMRTTPRLALRLPSRIMERRSSQVAFSQHVIINRWATYHSRRYRTSRHNHRRRITVVGEWPVAAPMNLIVRPMATIVSVRIRARSSSYRPRRPRTYPGVQIKARFPDLHGLVSIEFYLTEIISLKYK